MNRRAAFLPLVFLMNLGILGCDVGDGSARPNRAAEPTTQPTSHMKIRLKFLDKPGELTATLYNTPTALDFASMLPLTLTLEDYSRTEKVSDLPRKLTKEGAPAGADPSVGDIAFYAPWGNLAIYYKDFGYSDDLILLGKLDGGAETLSAPESLEVTIERIEE